MDIQSRSSVYTPADFLPVGVDLGTSATKIINPLTSEKHRILSIVGELPAEEPSESIGLKKGPVNNIAYESEDDHHDAEAADPPRIGHADLVPKLREPIQPLHQKER